MPERDPSLPADSGPASATPLTAAHWREIIAHADGRLPVRRDSMAPTLCPGEDAHVQPCDGPLAAGRVGVYLGRDGLVIHRSLGHGRFRGDNCLAEDPPVDDADVVGYVVGAWRCGSYRELPVGISGAVRWHRVRLHAAAAWRSCLRLAVRMRDRCLRRRQRDGVRDSGEPR